MSWDLRYRHASETAWRIVAMQKTCDSCGEKYIAHSHLRRWCDWCKAHLSSDERRQRAKERTENLRCRQVRGVGE